MRDIIFYFIFKCSENVTIDLTDILDTYIALLIYNYISF
jgi:hypothetical protein